MFRYHRFLKASVAATLLMACWAPAWAQEGKRRVLKLDSPGFKPYPVAIPQVQGVGGQEATSAAATVTRALRFDFGLVATFEVSNPKSYLADPGKEGITAPTIRFDDWLAVGAEGLIKGVVRKEEDELRLELRFFEVVRGRSMLSKTYRLKGPDEARTSAHAFSDAVIEALTGTRGIFQTQIAVVRKSKKGREVWAMDLDGSRLRPITRNGSINLLPSWTNTGAQILFTSYIRHNPNLYRVGLDGSGLTLLSGERGLNTGGDMSPNKQIAMTLSRDGNSEIYTMNENRTGLKRLTQDWAIDSSPSWSPDGSKIAFVSSRVGDPQIFVMNADGTNPTRMTFRGNYNTTPDWSPRGDVIAFTARDERNAFDIFTVHVETKEIRRLTEDQGNNEEPSFAPDGQHIVFTSKREGRSQVWVMAVDGSNQKRLTAEGGFTTPSWSPFR